MHWTCLAISVVPLVAATNHSRKVILDNDWGTVEFPPYLMALEAGWDVLGLVSDTANTWSLQCGLHALATLELGGLDKCIPVHKGADWPLVNTPELLRNWEMAYGALPFSGAFKLNTSDSQTSSDDPVAQDPSGTDPFQINRHAFAEGYPNSTFASEDGAMFLVEQVRKYPGQVSIYSAGSLTNIALAVRMDSTFAKNAKELVIMGGYIDLNLQLASGDQTLSDISSDVNLKMDPEAAKIALTADFPQISIVGNVANTVFPNEAFYKQMRAASTPYSSILNDHLVKHLPIWDSVAAAVMLNQDVVINSTDVYVDVNIARSSPTYGNIFAINKNLQPTVQKLQRVRMVMAVDVQKVRDMIVRAVTRPKGCAELAKIRGSKV